MSCFFKILPSTEKCFTDEKLAYKAEIKQLSMLRNERLEFQIGYEMTDADYFRTIARLEVYSDIREHISVCRVEQVPVALAMGPGVDPRGFLRSSPGLYPDLLLPIEIQHKLIFIEGELHSLFISIENQDGLPAGDHTVTFRAVTEGGECLCEASVSIHVIDAMLPESTLIHTQWFYCDCLAQYYEVDVFSERHWKIIENFVREAVESGINMLLTPVFTPPLDTAVGGERPTVQLIDVTVTENGYVFGYEKFDRWADMASKLGIKYFEISHLFTQWGCAHAPKIIANVNGEEKKIFGWETDAHGNEYHTFLRAFLTDFVAHTKKLGIDGKCYYHLSDEPNAEHLEAYMRAKNAVWDIIGDYPVIDALSDYRFYECGAVKNPIPSTNHIEPFLENNVPELWTYYCLGQQNDVSNRLVAMPGARTRILGVQLFKYDIAGFLHWGYNFYNCMHSQYPINPYADTCGEFFAPAGDTFSVYPGKNGMPYRTLHGSQFTEALTDHRALTLCASLIGKEKTVELIDEGCEQPITFKKYPTSQSYLLQLREKINSAIEAAVKK